MRGRNAENAEGLRGSTPAVIAATGVCGPVRWKKFETAERRAKARGAGSLPLTSLRKAKMRFTYRSILLFSNFFSSPDAVMQRTGP